MCLLLFQSLSGVLQSTQADVSTNGYLKGWQCSLLISNVQAFPGPWYDIFVVADDDDNFGHGTDGDADTDVSSALMASKHEPGIGQIFFYDLTRA